MSKYEIFIDYREYQLLDELKNKLTSTTSNLVIGDVIFKKDDKIEFCLERKTIPDLASSIKDGRYAEQSYRLDKIDHPNHNIVYIIEGDVQFWGNRYTNIKPKTLYVSMFCINFFKGFSVFNSKNERETAEYLLRISNKLNRETKKQGYYVQKKEKVSETGGANDTNKEVINNKEEIESSDTRINRRSYVDVKSRVKKDHITPDNIGEIILSQIPGVSAFISKVIMSHFESLHDLLNKLKKDQSCLDNIKYKLKSGQERRITKKSIVNIIKYLLYQTDTTIVVNTE